MDLDERKKTARALCEAILKRQIGLIVIFFCFFLFFIRESGQANPKSRAFSRARRRSEQGQAHCITCF